VDGLLRALEVERSRSKHAERQVSPEYIYMCMHVCVCTFVFACVYIHTERALVQLCSILSHFHTHRAHTTHHHRGFVYGMCSSKRQGAPIALLLHQLPLTETRTKTVRIASRKAAANGAAAKMTNHRRVKGGLVGRGEGAHEAALGLVGHLCSLIMCVCFFLLMYQYVYACMSLCIHMYLCVCKHVFMHMFEFLVHFSCVIMATLSIHTDALTKQCKRAEARQHQ
jgi:hypothetical protein